jgi:predicted AAA+ superfamily ATPase
VVLDEAQGWPEVFPRLRGAIDADRKRKGRFLLLGSISPALMVHVSESLAGRLSLIELTPLLLDEVRGTATLDRLWLSGGYPDGGVLGEKTFPRWQLDYMTLLVQRDLPSWGLPAKPQTSDRLVRMLAALHGQAWNASQVGQSLGLSYHTINDYADFLAGAFLIRRLSPFQPPSRKRLTKRAKLFWRDSGLLHALLGVTSRRDLLAKPWVGASWEGFVIEQCLGKLSALGKPFREHYFRTSDGYEADLVLELDGETWAIEVKLTSQPTTEMIERLKRTGALIGADRHFLLTQTTRRSGDDRVASLDLTSLLEMLG